MRGVLIEPYGPGNRFTVSFNWDMHSDTFNGLRQIYSASLTYSYKLTEHSSLQAQATFLSSDARRLTSAKNSRVLRADINYNRELNQRLSMGLEARGGYRESSTSSTGRTVSQSSCALGSWGW